jgi:hypothetical protein
MDLIDLRNTSISSIKAPLHHLADAEKIVNYMSNKKKSESPGEAKMKLGKDEAWRSKERNSAQVMGANVQ